MFDLIIKNGRIIDGTGNAWYVSDIGVKDKKISYIGDLSSAEAIEVVDAAGKYVTPGFIDVHQHSDFTLLAGPMAESALEQGITSCVVGLCGLSGSPVRDPKLVTTAVYGYQPSWGVELDWKSVGDYLDRLEKTNVAMNVGTLVGHGTLRLAAIGFANRPCTPEEQTKIEELLEQSLSEGALGLSSGLEYSPGLNADIEEMIALNKIVAKHKKVYHTHIRNKEFQIQEAIEEALRTAKESGVTMEISHLTPRWWCKPGAPELVQELLDKGRADGVDVTCDLYPDSFCLFSLAQFIPPWAFVDGPEGVLKHLQDPESRAKILQHTKQPIYQLAKENRWDYIVLGTSKGNPDLVGKDFFEIAKIRGKDPHNALLDVLYEEGTNFFNLLGYCTTTTDEDIAKMIKYDGTVMASDAYTLSTTGVLKDTNMGPAPYTWTTKYLTQYIRDWKVLPLEKAITKLTSLPAERVGLLDRGLIRPGCWADIVIFDYDNLKVNATMTDPCRAPSGIEHVFVNGAHTVENGKHTGRRNGMVLRK